MLFTSASVVLLIIRDVYDAFLVYSFLTLILEYAGGEHSCIEQIKHQPPIRRPFPLCRFPAIRRDASLLRACKQGTLQFVAIKPIMAIISLCVYFIVEDSYYDKRFQIPLMIILNTSYSTALYYLLLFFFATRSILHQFNVVRKFVAVKIFVFATFWFSVVLQARFKTRDGMQVKYSKLVCAVCLFQMHRCWCYCIVEVCKYILVLCYGGGMPICVCVYCGCSFVVYTHHSIIQFIIAVQ